MTSIPAKQIISKSLQNSHFALLLIVLSLLFTSFLFDLYLEQTLLLGFGILLLHYDRHSSCRFWLVLLFLFVHFLLKSKHLQAHLLLLLKLPFFLSLAYVGLKVFELVLGCSLALLVVVNGLRDGFDGGVSDGYQDWLLVFAVFFPLDLLLLHRHLFLELRYSYLVFYNLLDVLFH